MDIDRIILKYLKGEASLDEQHKLMQWLSEDQANKHSFKEISKYWKSYTKDFGLVQEDVENKIFNRIKHKEKEVKARKKLNYKMVTGIAASILIILSSIWYLDQYMNLSQEPSTALEENLFVEKASLPGQKITTKLPDGSIVRLNSGSTLIVPEKFNNRFREVELTGEAFFDVAKDAERPFIIHTKDFSIRVLGTSFNVKAYPNDSEKLVAVKTGLVNVKSKFNKSVELSPDQMVNIQGGAISDILKTDNKLVYGWIDHLLVFQDRSLSEAFDQIELWFGVELTFDNLIIPEKPITASFENPTLEEVMSNISKVYGFNYQINDEKVLIEIRK